MSNDKIIYKIVCKTKDDVNNYINNKIKNNEKYKCPICFNFFITPIQMSCGHRVCQACRIEITKCPLCREKIRISTFIDINFQRKIKNIMIECPNCNKSEKITIFENHIDKCPAISETCKNGCIIPDLNRSNIKAHYDECPDEVIKCKYDVFGCDYKCKRKNMDEHYIGNEDKHYEIALDKLNMDSNNNYYDYDSDETIKCCIVS